MVNSRTQQIQCSKTLGCTHWLPQDDRSRQKVQIMAYNTFFIPQHQITWTGSEIKKGSKVLKISVSLL